GLGALRPTVPACLRAAARRVPPRVLHFGGLRPALSRAWPASRPRAGWPGSWISCTGSQLAGADVQDGTVLLLATCSCQRRSARTAIRERTPDGNQDVRQLSGQGPEAVSGVL